MWQNPTRARARKGEAQGVLSYQKVKGIFDNPHNMTFWPLPEANLQDPLWTDLKAELVDPTLVNLGMWPCDRNEMAQEWKKNEHYVVRITKPPLHRYIRYLIHTAKNETGAQANNTSIGDKVPIEDLDDDEYILHV